MGMPRTGHYTAEELLRADAARVIAILQTALEREWIADKDPLILAAIGELKHMAETNVPCVAPTASATAGAAWRQSKYSHKTAEDEAIAAAPRLLRALLKLYMCGSGEGNLILPRDWPLLEILQNLDEENKLSVSIARRMSADEVTREAERLMAEAESKANGDADRLIDEIQEARPNDF